MVALLTGAAWPAWAGSISNASGPDPLLSDSGKGPCADLAARPEYSAGTDADGNPVVPADVADGRLPLPDTVAVPLPNRSGRRPAYVAIDGHKMEPLLNPPTCHR